MYALNVRSYQLSPDGCALRVSRQNLHRALRLIGRSVVLYRPRDEDEDGYYGFATIANVEVDRHANEFIWLELGGTTHFSKVVSLDELLGAVHVNDMPFHTYSKGVRLISPYEEGRLSEISHVKDALGFHEEQRVENASSDIPERWSFRKTLLRHRLLRAEMLTLYGPACVFTELLYTSLSGKLFETQVGHLVAREYRGPDIIQNVLPMSGTANWHWDHGLISLTNPGKILVSSRATRASQKLFKAGKQIRFADSKFWPHTEYLEWHRDNIFEKGRQPGLTWSRSPTSVSAA